MLEVAKDYVGSNIRFAISNEEDYEEELKPFGFQVSYGHVPGR